MLLHGQPGAGVLWAPVIELLAPDFEVAAPDRPGYGVNSARPGGYWTNIAWLARFLEAQRRDIVLVGHSWATGVALGYALRRDERLRGLVLVSPVGPGAVNVFDRVLALPIAGPALAVGGFFVARPVLHRVLARDVVDRDTRAELVATMRANHDRAVWRSFVVEQRALLDELPAMLEHVGDTTVPTVVVAGTRDRVTPPSSATALVRLLQNGALVEVPGGGHQLPRTHPRIVADAVRSLVTP